MRSTNVSSGGQRRYCLAVVTTHPIQYYGPWFAHLAGFMDVHVFYGHRQTDAGQAEAGFGKNFDWDLPLLDGYPSTFLSNVSANPSVSSFGGIDTPEVAAKLAAGNFDAVMLFGWNKRGLVQAWWGARRARLPVLVRLDSHLSRARGGLVGALKRPVYSTLLPRAGHYLSPGAGTDAYLAHFRVPARQVHRVPHMVDVARFKAGADAARCSGEAARLRAEYGASEDDTVLLFVGKLIGIKRPLLMLKALSKLDKRHRPKLWIAGSGPLSEAVDTFVNANKLPVRRLGFVNQTALPAIYAAADCLILPSKAETWGLVVNEAQACGLPAIVSSEAGCADELITEGVTGWTMGSADTQELAQLIAHAVQYAKTLPRGPINNRARRSSYQEGTTRLMDVLDRVVRSNAPDKLGPVAQMRANFWAK